MNKNIIVGVTGGIAAYKSAELVRLLRKAGADVKVIMTKHAQEFITPLTLQTLSGNNVCSEMFQQNLDLKIEHIALARWADAIIIAPATANVIAKLAYGIADDLLTTVCLASATPIAIAPAMNMQMWNAAITQENIAKLKNRGYHFCEPQVGELACGEVGLGKMLEPIEIVNNLSLLFNENIFHNKKIVITAGPTQEPLDPVRFLSNRSSGKMGYALAQAAQEYGAEVVLVSGPTKIQKPEKVKCIDVQTVLEMRAAVLAEIADCDIFISAAAVSDYRPVENHSQKIKKSSERLTLELQKNPDILAEIAGLKHRPYVIGFAAETENLLANAQQKLLAKNLDMIIANQIGANCGFEADENAVIILQKNHEPIAIPKMQKTILAREILEIVKKTNKILFCNKR